MITVTQQVRARIEAGDLPVDLIRIDFNGVPPVFPTTAGHDIEWDGETWLSNGFLLDTDGYERVTELRTESANIALTGVDLSIAAILLNNPQNGRSVTIYKAFTTASGGVIPDPYIQDRYLIQGRVIEQGTSDATVTLSLSGEWADFETRRGIRSTDTSLQRIHEGDRLFAYSKDVKKEIRWGGK